MPDDLITDEGVDEGSKDPEPTQELDATGPDTSSPQEEPAAPVPPPTTPTEGPGQELAEGEG